MKCQTFVEATGPNCRTKMIEEDSQNVVDNFRVCTVECIIHKF